MKRKDEVQRAIIRSGKKHRKEIRDYYKKGGKWDQKYGKNLKKKERRNDD